MPGIMCTCGTPLKYGRIPCEIEYLFISDVAYDNYQGKIDAEELYREMRSFLLCPNCKRIWIYWNGYREDPTEYVSVNAE